MGANRNIKIIYYEIKFLKWIQLNWTFPATNFTEIMGTSLIPISMLQNRFSIKYILGNTGIKIKDLTHGCIYINWEDLVCFMTDVNFLEYVTRYNRFLGLKYKQKNLCVSFLANNSDISAMGFSSILVCLLLMSSYGFVFP